MSAARVRSPEAADVPALARLRAARRGTPDEARAWAERRVAREPAAGELVVAELRGALVGYGVLTWFAPAADAPAHAAPAGGYLTGLMVDPAHRRRGVGAALVARRLEGIFARSAEAFYFADDDNAATIALHAGFGFQPLKRRFWFPGLAAPESAMTLYRAAR